MTVSLRLRLALTLLLPLSACTKAAQSAAPRMATAAQVAPAPPLTAPAAPSPAAPALPAGVPDSATGRQLVWVLAAIAHPPSAADAAPHFAESFVAQVPLSQVAALFAQLSQQLPPLTIEHVEESADGQLVAVVRSGNPQAQGAKVKLSLRVEAVAPQRLTGLLLRPVADAPPATSWDDVHARLRAVAPNVSFLAADISGGQCRARSAIEPQKILALGSTFKLYILEALARQIAAGQHSWDELITIDEAKKSLPSGELQDAPAGKTFTVRQVAEKMISISDNTATDHLLAFVGRAAVEAAVKASGHSAPARMIPFLSTRELFALKLATTPAELTAYAHADVAHKRKLLSTFAARDLHEALKSAAGWEKPRQIDSLEYFASPDDLCKLMASLAAHAQVPATAPVKAILSLNPGIVDDTGAYEYIGYKGGSEPGVLNLTWLLRRKGDDHWLFVSAGFNDRDHAIDETKGVFAATAARDYLAK